MEREALQDVTAETQQSPILLEIVRVHVPREPDSDQLGDAASGRVVLVVLDGGNPVVTRAAPAIGDSAAATR